MTFYIEARNPKGIRRIEVQAITTDEAEEKAMDFLGEGYFIERISTFESLQRS